MRSSPTTRRGRPLKFGRPAQLLAVRLPENAVKALGAIHPDPAWAIVSLIEGAQGPVAVASREEPPIVELVKVGEKSLILVDQGAVTAIPGVDIIPLSGGRAFLALNAGQGMSELELAVNDRLREKGLTVQDRKALKALGGQLRDWRRSGQLAFHSRAIIVAEPVPTAPRRRPSARRAR